MVGLTKTAAEGLEQIRNSLPVSARIALDATLLGSLAYKVYNIGQDLIAGGSVSRDPSVVIMGKAATIGSTAVLSFLSQDVMQQIGWETASEVASYVTRTLLYSSVVLTVVSQILFMRIRGQIA